MPSSAGTKVSNSKVSPVVSENPGPVPRESLAAESAAFIEGNPPGRSVSGSETISGSSITKNAPTGEQQQQQAGNGSMAPTYVASQYVRDTTGPHGRNITEQKDKWDESKFADGVQKAMSAEIGSADDPSRAVPLGLAGKKGASKKAEQGGQYEALGETDA